MKNETIKLMFSSLVLFYPPFKEFGLREKLVFLMRRMCP